MIKCTSQTIHGIGYIRLTQSQGVGCRDINGRPKPLMTQIPKRTQTLPPKKCEFTHFLDERSGRGCVNKQIEFRVEVEDARERDDWWLRVCL